MKQTIVSQIKKYFQRCFEISARDQVVFTVDPLTDVNVVKYFSKAVELIGSKIEILDCGKTFVPYRSVSDKFKQKIMAGTRWIDFTDQMAVHSPLCKEYVKNGGHFLLLPNISEQGLSDALVCQDIDAILALTRKMSSAFRCKGKLEIVSSLGTNLTVSLIEKKISLARIGELMQEKGREIMFYGYALIPISFEDMNGELVVGDYIWPPNSIKLVREPIKIIIKNGTIVEMCDSLHAKELRAWFESFYSANVYKVTHLTLGILPGMQLTDSLLTNERIQGALTFGFGNVWNGTSPTHTDMVVRGHDIFINGQTLKF